MMVGDNVIYGLLISGHFWDSENLYKNFSTPVLKL